MSDQKRRRNNNRVSSRKKARHSNRIDNYHLDQLYQEAQLDPQTVEGQGRIDIEVISPTKQKEPTTWGETFWSYLGY